jgi:hypothetical protein
VEVPVNARILLIVFCFWQTGCATTPQQAATLNENNGNEESEQYIVETYCSPAFTGQSVAPGDSRSDVPLIENERARTNFPPLSPASRRIAEVIQVDALLGQIPSLETEVARNIPGARIRLLELR